MNLTTRPSVEFVTTLFRILKLAGMHDLHNSASQNAMQRAAETFEALTLAEDTFFSALFANETVYVNGQPLNAERQVYDFAIEAGQILDKIGVNEITVRRGVTREALEHLLAQIAALRPIQTSTAEILGKIRLRQIAPELIIGAEEDELPLEEQILSTYASACVLAQRFDERLREGDLGILRHLKRVAQRLVTLSLAAAPHFLAIGLSPVGRHAGKRRVHAAVIGILTAQVVTDDLRILMRIAYVLLTQDVGLPRVAGMYRSDGFGARVLPRPNASMRARIPDANVVMLLQSGRSSPPAIQRARASYESHWLGYHDELGWPYKGKLVPDPDAVLLASVRRFTNALWESDDPDDVVEATKSAISGGVNIAGTYLVFTALGIYPAGTPVMLQDGRLGVVVSAGRSFEDLNPRVLILMDAHARLIEALEVPTGVPGSPRIDCVLHQCPPALLEAYEDAVEDDDTHVLDNTAVLLPPAPDPADDFGTLDPDRRVGEMPEFS